VIRDSIPVHIAGRFRDPTGFERSASGQYFVFDRRSQIVFGIDADRQSAWEIVHIGSEPGRIINPVAFASEPSGTFVVADAPNNQERIQIFTPAGFRIGGFLLPGRTRARVVLDGLALNGIGSLQYTGKSVLLSHRTLVPLTESFGGTPFDRSALSGAGPQRRGASHHCLAACRSSIRARLRFVFQSGERVFRKYDAVAGLRAPHSGPRRSTTSSPAYRRHSLVGWMPARPAPPTIRTAAADRNGHLWISFVEPFTYEFDADGDKVHVLQFRAAGIVSPNHLFFDAAGRVLVTPGLYMFDVK
jgi:hypothetical protein